MSRAVVPASGPVVGVVLVLAVLTPVAVPAGWPLLFTAVLWLAAAAGGLWGAQERQALHRQLAEAGELAALAARLAVCTEPRAVAATLLEAAVSSCGAARGLVVAGPEAQPALLAHHGLDQQAARRPGRPGPSSVLRTTTTRRLRALAARDETWLSRLLPGARDVLVLPLTTTDRACGVLVLALDGGPLPRPDVVAGLERAAAQAALGLRTTWLLEQVQRLAATDGLTKIANRRTFEATLERELARAARAGEHLSLVMIDIDHFKQLNDAYGHQAGDEVLRNVALALSCECRDFDTPARYGGEEFAVVLPGCGPQEAFEIAERLRLAVSAAPSSVGVTASAGVATFPGQAADADTLVRAADAALYRSKDAGRDRTTVSPTLAPEVPVGVLLRRAVTRPLPVGPLRLPSTP